MPIIKGSEPFLLPGDSRGVLLTHGFTGAPPEMRLLGDYLNSLGYTVLAPRLSGHGSTVEEMNETAWPHWYGTVEDGYYYLSGLCSEISAIGLSMGGILSLKLAAEYPLRQVVSLSSPIYIADKRLPLLPVYRLFRNFVPQKPRTLEVEDIYNLAYDSVPLKSLASLLELIELVKNILPAIKVPALIVQSRNEHTVKPESAQYIYDHLGSPEKKIIWLKKSGHVVTLDSEKEVLFEHIAGFLQGEYTDRE